MSELYLPLDNETGGLSDNVSLLSTYLEVVDHNFNVVDSLDLFVKPNDGVYLVEAGGLEVNKIDLVQHDKTAIPYSAAGQLLFKFLQKNSDDGKNKLIPLGKNVKFDVDGVTKHLLSKKVWQRFVSYREMDITPIARALQIKGKLPAGMSLSLFALADHLGVTGTIPGNPHEGKYDTKTTLAVFIKLMELM